MPKRGRMMIVSDPDLAEFQYQFIEIVMVVKIHTSTVSCPLRME